MRSVKESWVQIFWMYIAGGKKIMKERWFCAIIRYIGKVNETHRKKAYMDNRPVGREKRVVSGGEGIRRSGEGLQKNVSARNVRKNVDQSVERNKGFLNSLFGRKK